MLNRKELFHRNLIDEHYEATNQDPAEAQNNEGNGGQLLVAQSNNAIGLTQGRSGIPADVVFREEAPQNVAVNNVNLMVANRTQSSHVNQRHQNNKKESKTVKRVQGKCIKNEVLPSDDLNKN